MNRFSEYMQDRRVENVLSAEEREEIIYYFYQGVAFNRMEGEELLPDEEEFVLYCVLNDIPSEEMLDVVFTVKGWELLDHAKAHQSRLEYESLELK